MRFVTTVRAVGLAFFCVCLVGCSSNNKGKIEGTKWTSVAQTLAGQAAPEGLLQLEFKSDGKLVYVTGPITHTGTYKLGMGDSVTLKLDKELGGRKEHVQKVKINGNELLMIDSDGTTGKFKKVQ